MNPYRVLAPPPEKDAAGASFESTALTTLMLVVGGLGVALGIVRPQCTVELSIGLLLLFFVAGRSLPKR